MRSRLRAAGGASQPIPSSQTTPGPGYFPLPLAKTRPFPAPLSQSGDSRFARPAALGSGLCLTMNRHLIREVSPLRQSSHKRVQFASFCSTVGKSSGPLLPGVTQRYSRPDPAPLEGWQGTAKPRTPIPGLPERRQGRGASAQAPPCPLREGTAGHGAAQGNRKPRRKVLAWGPLPTLSIGGMRRVEGWEGDTVRAPRLQAGGLGASAGGAAALRRSFLPYQGPRAQGRSGPTMEGPQGLRARGALLDGCVLRCWGDRSARPYLHLH